MSTMKIYHNPRCAKSRQTLALLHCVSSYPVPNEQANLASIKYLKEMFPDSVVGYSDHTIGITAAVLSVIAGARIVEKHFTLDKNYSDFRDHKLSADPKEMSLMVKILILMMIYLFSSWKKIVRE